MSAQKGCFTIHGTNNQGFEEIFPQDKYLVEKGFFKKYVIEEKHISEIRKASRIMGMTESVIYPDLSGLAKELKERFWSNKSM